MLSEGGHDVSIVSDGAMALELLSSEMFDLVITDILMPDVDGLEVLTRVRRNNPALPIVALSGGGAYVERDYCLRMAARLGARDVIEKPVRAAKLLDVVGRVLTPVRLPSAD